MLFTITHQPQQSTAIPQAGIRELQQFLKAFPKKRIALIHGPSGSGKTGAVHVIAKENGLELFELNASDLRNKDQIMSRAGNAMMQMSLFAKGKLILIDEIDGIAGRADRGGVQAINELAAKTAFPIVMTANDPWNPKLATIRKKSVVISFPKYTVYAIQRILRDVAAKEGITIAPDAVREMSRRSQGDMRAALLDLQSLAAVASGKPVDLKAVEALGSRDRVDSLFEAIRTIFKTMDGKTAQASLDHVEEELDYVLAWLAENVPREYSGKALAKAYDQLSHAYVFLGRIRRQQYWRFLAIARTLATAGVALAKDQPTRGFTRYQRPSRIRKRYHEELAELLAEKTHCSLRKARQELPFIRAVAEKVLE